MSEKNLTPLEKVDACCNFLDKLADAQGRAKCGYIYIISEFLNDIRSHILILEEQVNDINQEKETVIAKIPLNQIADETISQE